MNCSMVRTMSYDHLQKIIVGAWPTQNSITPANHDKSLAAAVNEILDLLGIGKLRVAEKIGDQWCTHQWLKMAVLLSFRLRANKIIKGGAGGGWFDKVDSKWLGWGADDWQKANFRAVPNAVVRHSAFIAPSVVLMPSFVNVGAYVDSGTMVDTWSTVGSCAQIGKNVHLSGGVGIGGVLEPLQANPTIIEDDCFIGARAEVAEGVIVGQGSVLAMGVFLSASTKIIDRATGKVFTGHVPPYSVVVAGSLPNDKKMGDGTPSPNLYCAVIVKRVDEKTRAKTSINELLRD